MNVSYKAILFDLDGTLLDTAQDLMDSMNYVLNTRGFPEHDLQKFKTFIGLGVHHLVKEALPQDKRDPITIEACYTEMKQQYGVRWKLHTIPYSAIPQLLNSLSKHQIITTVFSNKEFEFVKDMVDYCLPEHSFNMVIGTSPTIPSKPNPHGATLILNSFSIPKEKWIYVGDSDIDMQTAVSAGIKGIFAKWGYQTSDPLQAHEVLSNPEALLEL